MSKSFANVEGSMYFHPVATAFNAIRALVAGDRDAARVYADLLYRHAEDGWLAYDFDWEWPTANIIEAPWYSALAQALALTVYSRLGQRERADEAFETVIEMQRDDGWLPEYPAGPDVLNGHIFATLGLYDYWEFTGRGKPETLAAVRVLADRVHEWRRPGTISRYAGEYPAYGIYHRLHVMLLDWMESITANPCFGDAARAFEGDFTGP